MGTRCGAGQQAARQRALLTRCRSTWRRATRRSRRRQTASTTRCARSSVGAVLPAPGCAHGCAALVRIHRGTGSWESGSPARLPSIGVPAVPGPRPFRDLRPRAVLRGALRLLRLQHLHAVASWRGSGASPDGWLDAVRRELALARAVVGATARSTRCSSAAGRRRCSAPRGSRTVLDAVRSTFGLAPGAEVTTESNPESTSPEFFAGLREAGFTRVSLGMQSAAPHVLRVLDRRHTPGRAARGGAGGARGGVRARQPRPDLRHAGGDRRRPAARRWTPCWPPGSTTSRRTR